jgi:hypothetical protein
VPAGKLQAVSTNVVAATPGNYRNLAAGRELARGWTRLGVRVKNVFSLFLPCFELQQTGQLFVLYPTRAFVGFTAVSCRGGTQMHRTLPSHLALHRMPAVAYDCAPACVAYVYVLASPTHDPTSQMTLTTSINLGLL